MKLSERLTKLIEDEFDVKVTSIHSNGRQSNDDVFFGVFSWYAKVDKMKIIGSTATMTECLRRYPNWELCNNSSPYDNEIIFTKPDTACTATSLPAGANVAAKSKSTGANDGPENNPAGA